MKRIGGFSRVLGWLFIASGVYGLFQSPIPGVICLVVGILLVRRPGRKGADVSAVPADPAPSQVVSPAPVAIPHISGGAGSFGSWDISVHGADGQDVRFDRALFQRISILSYDERTGVATVRGTHGDTYQTTLDACTCEDFQRRGLPCKHIYKVAMSAGYSADDFYSARSDVVWYADSCRVYHSCPDCRGLRNRFPRRTTVALAEYKGLRPCKSCCETDK